MKNAFYFSIILIISSFFFSGGIKDKKLSSSVKQKISDKNSNIDSIENKLPGGNLFITNFNLTKKTGINSISQDSSGLMLLLNSKGVILFDGITEQNIYIETVPNKIKKDINSDRFFISSKKGFGVLKKNTNGSYVYEKLSADKFNNENYTEIITGSDKVRFVSSNKIVSIQTNDYSKYETEFFDPNQIISGAFVFKNKFYINLFNTGLHSLEKNVIHPVTSNDILNSYEIIFSVPFNNNLIIGTGNNKLYEFDGKIFKEFKSDADDYIKESIITDGIDYNENEFLLTTLNGGALLINKKTGKTIQTINYRTGLPDDEIYSAFICKSNGIWLSHDYGISRVALDIPVTNYSYYPGLQGNINYVKVFDSTLYVATGEGLFYLSQIKSYDEVEVAIKKRVRSVLNSEQNNPTVNNEPGSVINTETNIENVNSNDNFLSRWKKRRQKKQEATEIPDSENTENDANSATNAAKNNTEKKSETYTYKTVTEYKKIYELQSIKYTYKKIPEIKSKCRHLKLFAGGLLASTNTGLYFIKNKTVTTIIPELYIYNVSGQSYDKNIFVAGSDGIFKITDLNGKVSAKKIEGESIKDHVFTQVYKVSEELIWAVSSNNIFLLKLNDNEIISAEKFSIENAPDDDLYIIEENGKIYFLNNENAFFYNSETNAINIDNSYFEILRKTDKIYHLTDTSLILTDENSVLKFINQNPEPEHIKFAWLIDFVENADMDENKDIWITSRDNSILRIKQNPKTRERKFELFISEIRDGNDNFINYSESLNLESNYKSLNVKLSSPFYLKKKNVKYLYSIDNKNPENFIEFSESEIKIPELTPGNHKIFFRAKNALNELSNEIELQINIKPPFWQTKLFIIGVFTALLIIISLVISGFYRRKQKKIKEYNEILELKVKERTKEIQQQNKLIQSQNIEIYEQYQKINIQNEEITGSIRYAGRIQKAVLPKTDIQQKYLSGFFCLYKPRDIVSGDFYWMTEAQNKLFVAAVDCTGHGVPGGFLSMLGISFLNEIVIDLNKKNHDIKAADILFILRQKIITTLSHHADSFTQDGMDMALAIIDKDNMQLNFAGANNPGYIIRESKISKIEADRMPIGYSKHFNETLFTNRFVKLNENDLIYLYSDGYADQFGGQYGKKFNSRRFRELLMHIQKFPMNEQKEIAHNILVKWQNKYEQIDDILLIGIKI